MKQYTTEALRNLVLVGHGGTGKTSLADSFLFLSKVNNRLGSVDDETSLFDYDDEEKKRKISIRLTVGSFEWDDHKFNVIDTPGYDDFVGDVVSGIHVADMALMLIDAQNGVEVGTSRAWKFARGRHLPSIICVNKLDKEFSTFEKTYKNIRKALGKMAVAVTIPVNEGTAFDTVIDLLHMRAMQYPKDGSGKAKAIPIPDSHADIAKAARTRLVEQAAESDDKLLEKYFEAGELTEAEVLRGMRRGIAKRTFYPVFVTASKMNVGVGTMLDVIAAAGPSPLDLPPHMAADGETEIHTDSGQLVAQAFKTVSEAHMGDMTLFRVYSGELTGGTEPMNTRSEKGERIGQLYFVQGHKRVDAQKIVAGDIGAAVKLKDTHTGDTLTDCGFTAPPIPFPQSVIRSAVVAKTQGEEDKIGNGLARLHEEDPTFHVEVNSETHQTLIHGLGETQLDILVRKLKDRFNVEVELIEPKIPYRETIRKKAEGQGKYKKQSGGRGQYGDVWIRLEPLERGAGFEFVSEIVGGVVPTKFLPAIEKGIVAVMTDGILAGCQVVDVRAVAYDGSYHNVDSSENSFKVAGSMAFRKVFMEANPVLLEPIMKVKVTVPEDCMGDVMGDLSSRRGKIHGMDTQGHYQVVNAEVPLAELYKYSTHLRSLTGGRGIHEREFDHYAEVPKDTAEKVVAAHAAQKEAEAH